MKSYRDLGITRTTLSKLNRYFKGIYFANYSYFKEFCNQMTAEDFEMDAKQVYSLEYMFSVDISLSVMLKYFKKRLNLKFKSAKYILHSIMTTFNIYENTDVFVIDSMVLNFKP